MDNKPVIFRPAAERDLDEIWLYIAFDNPSAADAVIDQITDALSSCRYFRNPDACGPKLLRMPGPCRSAHI